MYVTEQSRAYGQPMVVKYSDLLPPGSAGWRDLSSLGAVKDDHGSFAMDGSLPWAGSQNCEGLVVKDRTAPADKQG